MSFIYNQEQFNGPIELLLNLIESHQMSVSEISLASVTREFCDYVESLEDFDSVSVAAFLSVASTLILIKAKSLIPEMAVTVQEETDIAELEYQLQQYALVQRGAGHIQKLIAEAPSLFSRESDWESSYTFLPDNKITAQTMQATVLSVVDRAAAEQIPVSTITESITVMPTIALCDIVSTIQSRLGSGMSFWDMVNSIIPEGQTQSVRSKKLYTIVSFLALLDLVKEGAVQGVQHSSMGEIVISTVVVSE
jgi:segregation and condensation protein A